MNTAQGMGVSAMAAVATRFGGKGLTGLRINASPSFPLGPVPGEYRSDNQSGRLVKQVDKTQGNARNRPKIGKDE
jgi:hypothetical protein